MEKLDGIGWRCVIDGVVDLISYGNTPHRNGSVGQCLCHSDDVWFDIEFMRCKGCSHSAKAGNHLIKHKQQAMFVTDFPNLLEISDWRNQRTG